MSDDTGPESDDAIPPPPSRGPKKKEPQTIRIQSGNPIPPGRVDFVPPNRSRRPDLDARTLAIAGIALVAVVLIVVAVIALASRGDDDPEPAAAASPTQAGVDRKDRFIARGDARCKRANRAQERLLFPAAPEEFPGYLEDTRDVVVRLIDDLRNLRQPTEDRRLLRRMLAKLGELPPVLTEAHEAAASGDVTAVEEILARGEAIEHRANALALQYGFEECSQP